LAAFTINIAESNFRHTQVFAIRIEHALDVAVERFHDADARHHCRTVDPRDKHQYFHRRLPFRRGVLGLQEAL